MTTEPTRFVNPATMHSPFGYSHLVETSGSRTVYLSGQVALSPEGEIVGANDTGLQAEQAFKNIAAGLEAVGATFDNVVKLTFFMIDMSDFAVVREVRDRFVNTSRPPASSAMQVSALAFDWIRVEVEAIAVID